MKGVTTFKVTNKGTVSHNFKIAGKKTVLIKAGKTATLKVTFTKAGKFPFLCTVPGHAVGGNEGDADRQVVGRAVDRGSTRRRRRRRLRCLRSGG